MHISIWTKRVVTVAIFAATGALAACASQEQTAVAATAHSTAVNRMCPIGEEPIVATVTPIKYKGNDIGFCCPGCGKAFMEWDEPKRDAWVALALKGKEPGKASE